LSPDFAPPPCTPMAWLFFNIAMAGITHMLMILKLLSPSH
jgi:hypothetical protein